MAETDDIIAKVDKHHLTTQALRGRWEEDHSLYRMSEYAEKDAEGEPVEGYLRYTTNNPKTYAKKILGWQMAAFFNATVPNTGKNAEQRDINDDKERWIEGARHGADLLQTRRTQPSLRGAFSWYGTIRGWTAARALIRKDSDDDDSMPYFDITPWDPLHTYWGQGGNDLTWACYRTRVPVEILKDEYPNADIKEGEGEDDALLKYDYYDNEINWTFTEHGGILKKKTVHGSPRLPVFIGVCGPMPLIESSLLSDTIADYGESIYEDNRRVYANYNKAMSIWFHLTALSRDAAYLIKSRSGTKTLDDDIAAGQKDVAMFTDEHIEKLANLVMEPSSAAFVAKLESEMQRGSIPVTAFGELGIAISGYAISQLRQASESPLQPRIDLLERTYYGVLRLLCDQYLTRRYGNFEVSGYQFRGGRERPFSDTYDVDRLQEADDFRITLKAILPQDDAAMINSAMMLRQPDGSGAPLMSDDWIREERLGVRDADQADDAIKTQMAERGLPEALLFTHAMAAAREGETELANQYIMEYTLVMHQKFLAMQQAMGMGPPPPGVNGANGNGSTNGAADPRFLPNAAAGIAPPLPAPQSGANVPEGSPRPGALTTEQRAAELGLVIAR